MHWWIIHNKINDMHLKNWLWEFPFHADLKWCSCAFSSKIWSFRHDLNTQKDCDALFVVRFCSQLHLLISQISISTIILSLSLSFSERSGSLAFRRNQTPASHVKPHCGEHNQPNVFLVRWMCVAVTIPVDIYVLCSLSLLLDPSLPPVPPFLDLRFTRGGLWG